MTPEIAGAAAMLGSAMTHAVMGMLTKSSSDKLVFRSVMMSTSAVLFLPLLFLLPPPPAEAWPFLIMGMGLHFVFQMSMISAFERGDMNLVYPVMRGAAPALAALFAFFILGEALSMLQIGGLALASATIIGFAWPDRSKAPKVTALAFAALAALMTALYSVNDASGVRATGNPLTYLAWFSFVTALPILVTALVRRGRRWPELARRQFRSAAPAAVLGAASYGLALFAFSIAAIGPMAAMRETSVVFGAILAALILKEPFGIKRSLLAIFLAAGLVLLQVG
ncbi:EamA family transporter [Hyphobacterium sp. CCMP332]|uniref:EamA family transporter n=1 Tax=Hyphobacterium sp. CCMP332 TaxID=2749086 RepID=UPI001F3E705A|nr:EamA family transporter [Hyphobacterium sp. CCMP332]